MASAAFQVFSRLQGHVQELRATAARELDAGHDESAKACLRSGIVLAVASLDTYFHEQGVRLLHECASQGASQAQAVVDYARSLSVSDVQGNQALGLLRLRLSYKTLVSPEKIDELLSVCGLDADDIWLRATAAVSSRPDRARRLVQLQIDRRNQIAHEGDWDPSILDFRDVSDAHLNDCMVCIAPLVQEFDSLIP